MKKKMVLSSMLAVVLYLCCSLCVVNAADYETPRNKEMYVIYSAANKKVLDTYGGEIADGTNIQPYKRNNGKNQIFVPVKVNSKWYKLVNVNSNKVLDVWGNSNKSASIKLYTYNGGDNQLFQFKSAGNGWWYIKNKMGYYLSISKNGKDIVTYKYNPNDKKQKWRFSHRPGSAIATPPEDMYTIHSAADYSFVMDVTGAYTDNGTPLEVWGDNGGNNQKFRLQKINSLYYRLVDVSSNRPLDVNGNIDRNGQMINIWDKNDSGAQKFMIYCPLTGDGSFFIRFAGGSRCIDISGGKAKYGANLVLWTMGKGKSQRWIFEKTTANYSPSASAVSISYPMNDYYVTQGFGVYNSNAAATKGRPYHSGLDMVSHTDTNIYAAADGRVVYAGSEGGNGIHVILSHSINGQNFNTLYSHMSSLNCSVGNYVSRGRKIGVMGNTGDSNGDHLHFSVLKYGGNHPYGYTSSKYNDHLLTQSGAYFYDPDYVIQNAKLP